MKRIGLIGHPVGHSWSACMHNHIFRKENIDAEYTAYDVEDLKHFLSKNTLDGFNVTIPYKEKIIRYLDEVSEEAKAAGAVNTVTVQDGYMIGYNTDGYGGLTALEEQTSIDGKRIIVVGAGGASRALVSALSKKAASVVVLNRTLHKARNIAHEFCVEYDTLQKAQDYDYDILINTSSVGMYPETGSMPVDKESLRPHKIVMDIVYNPLNTMLLEQAANKGCITIDGASMLVHQGARAIKIMLGLTEDTQTMKSYIYENMAVIR